MVNKISDEELIYLYRETHNNIYFNKLYNRYNKLRYRYSNANNSDCESDYNYIFTLIVMEKFNLNRKVLFKTFLITCLDNKSKSRLTQYRRHVNRDISIEYIKDLKRLDDNTGEANSKIFSEEYDFEDLYITNYIEDNWGKLIEEYLKEYSNKRYERRTREFLYLLIYKNLSVPTIAKMFGVTHQTLDVTKLKFKKFIKDKIDNL